MVVDYFLFWKY